MMMLKTQAEIRLKTPSLPERIVCASCGIKNLASFCEQVEAGDSIQEISEGEQTGAFFRSLLSSP